MIRKIIKINEEKCNGCGACATACHEGAIEMVNGKAKLTRESYCDGLGDCLPACPTGAITFEEREAPAYDEAAVIASRTKSPSLPCGCPGTASRQIKRANVSAATQSTPSQLLQWPVQIKLVPTNAPYFHGANLLVAADDIDPSAEGSVGGKERKQHHRNKQNDKHQLYVAVSRRYL